MISPAVAIPKFAYVGCFTSEDRNARGKGISVYRIDQASGEWKLVEIFETLPNPGFLAVDSRQRFLYSAHGDRSQTSAYAIDPSSGRLRLLNRQENGGDNTPHIAIDPTDHFIVVANGPGLAVFPVNSDGSLAPATDIIVPPGEPGPYREEQHGGAHPHQAVFDPSGRFMLVPDKGVDRTHVFRLDADRGKLIAHTPAFVKSRYGAGPRHICFHPTRPLAYVINELDATVTGYKWNAEGGELHPFQIMPTAPTTHTGNNSGAEINMAPSGRFIYASNRGHDSIGIFGVDGDSGMLSPIGWESTKGKKPRFVALDAAGAHLYAANLDSHTIVVFRIKQHTGALSATGQVVETGSPSCIVFTY